MTRFFSLILTVLILVSPVGGLALAGAATSDAATRTGIAALDPVLAALSLLPEVGRATTIGAHLSQEGHWTLVNASGEAFTAATPKELARGIDIMLPGLAEARGRLNVYLSAPTALERRAGIAELPAAVALWLVTADARLPLRQANGNWLAEIRPRLLLKLSDALGFDEAMRQFGRLADRARFRVIALEPGAGHVLAGRAEVDKATGKGMVDTLDPLYLASALSALRGQTAVLAGRLDGDLLTYRPRTGPERTLSWSEIAAAAAAADVNVLLMRASAGQQPGGRNWLWQTVEVRGLDEALRRATLADILDALAAPEQRLVVTLARSGEDRIILDAQVGSGLGVGTWTAAQISTTLSDAVSSLTGKVGHQGALALFTSAARQAELDRRIIPFIPSWVQWTYGILLLTGIAGATTALRWWGRIWPRESRADYGLEVGYRAAQVARAFVFALVFVPLVALFSAPRSLIGAMGHKPPEPAAG